MRLKYSSLLRLTDSRLRLTGFIPVFVRVSRKWRFWENQAASNHHTALTCQQPCGHFILN